MKEPNMLKRANTALAQILPKAAYVVIRRIYWQLRFFRDLITKRRLPGKKKSRDNVLDCQLAYNKYGAYCVPRASRHRAAARKIRASDVYEPQTIKYIFASCGDGDIVHAGAYFGDFLPALDAACSQAAYVWAFEPNWENFRSAKVTRILNDLNNVLIFPHGLGDGDGQACLQINEESGWPLGSGSKIVKGQGTTVSKIGEEIKIVALDNVVPSERRVSVVHLDIEGYELRALMGGIETIRRSRPLLILEQWSDSDIRTNDWFRNNIGQLGYRELCTIENNRVFSAE